MSEFIANFREKNQQYNDMSDGDLVTALHNKFYSDIPIEDFNQKIGYEVAPIEPDVNQQSDNFIQASPRPEAQQPLQTGYGASSDIPIQEQPQIDGYTGADTKQPFKPMGELVTEKLSAIGEGVLRAGQNVLPQFKSQLGGLMQAQETPLLTPTEFFANEQRGTIRDVPMQFESYEDYTKAHEQSQGPGNWIAEKGKQLRATAKGEMKPSTAERGSTEYYIEQGVGSILNMVPMLAVSIAGKRPDIGLGIMLAQVDGDAYGEGRDKGLSQQDAKAYAAFQSVAEVIPSALPLGKMLSGSGVITQGLSEGAQEVVTAALQAGIDKGYINPEMTWGEAAERMKDAAIIGAGSGATMALATKPFAPKEESYADDPLKAVAVEMEREASNKDMKDFVTKAFDKKTADVIVQDQAEKQGVIDELPAKEQPKSEQIKPEEVKAEITQEPIDKEAIPTQEPVAVDLPESEKPVQEAEQQAEPEAVEVDPFMDMFSLPQEKTASLDGPKQEAVVEEVAEPVKELPEVDAEQSLPELLAERESQLEEAKENIASGKWAKEYGDLLEGNIKEIKAEIAETEKETADPVVEKLDTAVTISESEVKDLQGKLDNVAGRLRKVPGWTETGRNNRSKSLGKDIERLTNEEQKVFKQLQSAEKALTKAKNTLSGYKAGTLHADGMPKSQKPLMEKANIEYSELVKTNTKAGDSLHNIQLNQTEKVIKFNKKTVSVETWAGKQNRPYTDFVPVKDGKPMTTAQIKEGMKTPKISLETENPTEKQQVTTSKPAVSPKAKSDEKTATKKPAVDVDTSVEEGTGKKATTITEKTTVKELNENADKIVENKSSIESELVKLDKKELNTIAKTPTPSAPKEKTAEKVYQQELYSNVAKSGAIVTFNNSDSVESQVESTTKKQTKLDIDKQANNSVDEATMSRDGKITYPEQKEDINTKEYKKLDSKMAQQPKDGERIFNAPGHNYVGLFRSTGIPERREFVMIEGRKLKIPDKPQRIEPIMSKLIKIMGRRIYFGKIKGKSSEGFYRPNVGEIRTRKKNDVEVLAHEMAHYLDFYSNAKKEDKSGKFLPNFQKLYKQHKYKDEISSLSYTTADSEIELIEGFAEFTRLWLTNAQEAQIRAPMFYEAFTNLLGRDRKLLNPMRDMQDLMHKFYFQGADKLGQALIGKNPSFMQRYNEWAYRRDSRIRQQMIDRFHAAREVERELTKKIGNVQESAWKQFRLAHGGSEGISDYIMNYGTVNFDEAGDLKRSGKSLHEVLEPVKSIKLTEAHKGEQKIDVLLRYFAGRRALELHRQGRENLIPKETAKEWARLGKEYPVFESIQQEYQAFNDRMMDFYEEAGMITPKGRKAMKSMNKDYVPFNRIRDQLAGGKTGAGGGIQKLKGGTANLNDILVNMQDGITANVRSALTNRAKQRLYQYISSHKDGAIFATKIAPDSKPVQVYADEMQAKIGKVLKANGIEVEGEIDLTDSDLLTFWQHGVKPKVNESGNIVDQVVIDGKPRYYEVQDPLLQEMLLSMNPESYSSFMNVMFGVKNFFTRSITLGVEFTGANLVRDTIGATFLSKNNFKPFISSFDGMYSFFKKDKYYQDFVRSGGGYSGRLEASTREGTARRRVSIDEFGVLSMPEKLLSSIDNLASAFEYGTRIGEFKLSKKNMKSDMDAGFDAREISTDFSAIGANRFLTGYIRTVPFLNAMIQSQDRVFREAIVTKQYDGNPTAMAMKAFLGITVPSLLLYLVNKDDEDYQAIPDYEKRTNWHISIGDGQFVKIPRPYDVGFVYATMPEIFAKYVEDDKGKEFAEGMIWTMTQMYGIDGVPAMMTGWWDLVRNKKWTGAPVVPQSLSNVEATEQYTSNTAETFVRMGEALGVSPIKAEHMFKAYTGYLGGYVLWGTDHMLWDESKFGEKPESKTSDNIFLRRFLTPDVRPSSSSMEKFFDIKEDSDRVVATFKQKIDIRRKIKGQMKGDNKFKDDRFFGLSGKEKEVLFALNDSMNKLIKLMYGKEGIKTAELKIKYDKNLSGSEKREKMDKLWLSRNKAFMQYYTQADQALQKAKREAKQGKD